MPRLDHNELFPIVDPDGNVIGSASRAVCHDGRSHLLHPVVHLHVITPAHDSILLQCRSLAKDIQPGRWDTAVGGHVDAGEEIAHALLRESREELGIDASGARMLCRYVWQSERESELVNVFILEAAPDGLTLSPDPDEVSQVRFWSFDEIVQVRGKGILTPNFEQELTRIHSLLPLL
ncbi:MAG: NUDIX domain-containing protein [Pseudoflavonifractor sp.]|nr:NUDIX domain-containing protein [Alloprevotella sp.]MCM1117299.1 NUDIX domain-containing protein [Pseudoflavonifractor sp.]